MDGRTGRVDRLSGHRRTHGTAQSVNNECLQTRREARRGDVPTNEHPADRQTDRRTDGRTDGLVCCMRTRRRPSAACARHLLAAGHTTGT